MGLNMGGLFTVGQHTIALPAWGKPVYLVPFGDVHFGAPNFAEDRWREFINERKGCPNTYYIGMGDYTDMLSGSERAIYHGLHDSTQDTMEATAMDMLNAFASTLEHARGRILGFVQGNHDMPFADGTNGTVRLAQRFKAAYMGCSTIRRLCFQRLNAKVTLDVYAHHGQGGGARLKGGSLNRVQYMAEAVEADIYLMGHDHQRGVIPDTRMVLQNTQGELRVKERQVWYARTGSFLKGYESGKRSYVADSARKPTDLGGITFEITASRISEASRKHVRLKVRTIQ